MSKHYRENRPVKYWFYRILQLITNIHRIHHIKYSYGYTFRPIPWAYFPVFTSGRDKDRKIYQHGWQRVNPQQYHDCTLTGVY